jgi:hypothetical protein
MTLAGYREKENATCWWWHFRYMQTVLRLDNIERFDEEGTKKGQDHGQVFEMRVHGIDETCESE